MGDPERGSQRIHGGLRRLDTVEIEDPSIT